MLRDNENGPGDGFAWVQGPYGPALVCRPLESVARHLFTTRQWALGTPAADADSGWNEVARAVGIDRNHLVRLRQVHGADVFVRRAGEAAGALRGLPEADIVVSNDASLGLAIQSADCVPLLIADSRSGAVAAAHAGWRGLAARVPALAVAALVSEFGGDPADMIAAAGPSISAARYEVGADVHRAFSERLDPEHMGRWFLPGRRANHWQFDGWQATRDQLLDAGLPIDRVFIASLCTASDSERFCSYRRDGSPSGRMAAVIRPDSASRNTVAEIDKTVTIT